MRAWLLCRNLVSLHVFSVEFSWLILVAIFCMELFRIPFVGCVDVCYFDKTGTITAGNLVLEVVVGVECVIFSHYFVLLFCCRIWFTDDF